MLSATSFLTPKRAQEETVKIDLLVSYSMVPAVVFQQVYVNYGAVRLHATKCV